MNRLFEMIFRLGLIFLGICFFIFLVFLFFVALIFFGIKQLWWKITGRKPQNVNIFRFSPKDGFSYFYTRTTSHKSTQGMKSRELEDITDVEIKLLQSPSGNGSFDPKK